MKIGIFNGGYLPNPLAGGGTTFQYAVLSSLAKKKSNHSFSFFCDELDVENLFQGLTVVQLRRHCTSKKDLLVKKVLLRGLRFWDQWLCLRKHAGFLQRAIHEHGIDVMWFLVPVYQPVDIPYVFTVWDLQHRLQPYFPEVSVSGSTYEDREAVYGSVLPRAAYIIVGNEAGKQEIERFYGVPELRIKVNPLPTPSFAFSSRGFSTVECLGELNNRIPYLFYPAQFWPHKNHVVILHALKLLKEQHKQDFEVVFTGSDKGNLAYIKDLVVQLGLESSVHFLGFVDQKTLVSLYQNAFALVFASFFGPDNIPPLEAFGFGCPVIAARVSGAEYQLEGAALLFDPKSENELVEKILQLKHDALIKQKIIDEGKKRAELYSSDRYIDKMIQIFDEFESIRRCWSSTVPYRHL